MRLGVALVAFASASAFAGSSAVRSPDLVAKVMSGEIAEAHVAWWGFDREDSTKSVQAALASPAKKVVIDAMPTPWYVLPLRGHSDQTVVIGKGAVLSAKRGAFRGLGDSLLTYNSASNVVLTGGGEIRMWREDYTNAALYSVGQWRHALSLNSCHKVRIEDLRIAESGGDGIYLGECRRGVPNTDVRIRRVDCVGNNRQGISVITADGLLIEDCVFRETKGAAPESGMDFEPNEPHQQLSRILVRNCVSENNAGRGVDFGKWLMDNSTPPMDITLEGCVFRGNRLDGTLIYVVPNAFRDVSGRIVFRRCELMDEKQTRKKLEKPSDGPVPFVVSVEECKVRDPDAAGGWSLMTGSWDRGIGREVGSLGVRPTCVRPAGEVVVRDACPGRSVRVGAPSFRSQVKFLVYAAKPGEVAIEAVQLPLGKYPLSTRPCRVEDASGAKLCELPCPGKEPVTWRLNVPKAGFYALYVNVGDNALRILSTTDPIAAVAGGPNYNRVANLSVVTGRLYFDVPERTSRFGVIVAGGGGREKVSVRLFDPEGKPVGSFANVCWCRDWLSDGNPAPGLWSVETDRPTEGYLNAHQIDFLGLEPTLFLTPEKTWSVPVP